MNKQQDILLHLSLIPHVGPITIISKILRGVFLHQFPDFLQSGLMEIIDAQTQLNLEDLYAFSVGDFVKKCGLTEKIATEVVLGLADRSLLEKEKELLVKHQVTFLTIFDDRYPEILKQIHMPPIVLYCKGAPLEYPLKSEIIKRFSIVGSRKADAYAHQIINSIVPALVANGWQIVSGGAEGVDTMAHRAAADAGGRTLAVMGSGFLHPYPPSNKEFFKKLELNNGTLISPFSLNTPPDRSTFPARNRIIAGLSQGCLVVQAAARSGALITAQFALDQGRLIFAIPGSIYDDLSAGCNNLIKQGAKLVNTVQDIFEDFNETSMSPNKSDLFTPAARGSSARTFPDKQQEVPAPALQNPLLGHLATSCTIDDLSNKTGLDLDELFDSLFALQLEGKVRQNFAGQWERT